MKTAYFMRTNRDLKGGTPPGYSTDGTLPGVVPLYGVYGDVPNDRVWFCLPDTPGAPFQDFSLKHSVIFFHRQVKIAYFLQNRGVLSRTSQALQEI